MHCWSVANASNARVRRHLLLRLKLKLRAKVNAKTVNKDKYCVSSNVKAESSHWKSSDIHAQCDGNRVFQCNSTQWQQRSLRGIFVCIRALYTEISVRSRTITGPVFSYNSTTHCWSLANASNARVRRHLLLRLSLNYEQKWSPTQWIKIHKYCVSSNVKAERAALENWRHSCTMWH